MDRPLIYAIGDVHGRADLLSTLLQGVDDHAAEAGASASIIFLGDIIDRGPESRRCLDLVRDTLDRRPGSRLLLGNHDDCLLSFFEGRSLKEPWFESWMGQGGRQTLASYDLDPDNPKRARRLLQNRHADHHDMLARAAILQIDEDFVFVHAGIDPARRLEAQSREDCLFIRKRFMNHVGPLPRIVVHGHTPQSPPRAVATENRISLDTGAFATGVLTALVIDKRSRTLETLATQPDGRILRAMPEALDRGFGTVLESYRHRP